jgi:hypothetical protein
MKRKNTLDDRVQVEAKTALRELRLQINRLERTYRQYRPQQYHDMPALDPTVVRMLVDETKRLRGQLTLWLSVVRGHRPVRLVYTCDRFDRRLAVLEIDLERERQLVNTK